MSKHHLDLIMCRKTRQPNCLRCDGKCPVCDSYVRPETLVRICNECNFGSYGGRCIICGSPGISDAYIQSRSHSPLHAINWCRADCVRHYVTPRY
ncbi:PHD finger-like domain-containing protein 5A [Lentinula raphanica]|nr:PHD finger-like domain-containing protein 5A [Lentinula raphanica]